VVVSRVKLQLLHADLGRGSVNWLSGVDNLMCKGPSGSAGALLALLAAVGCGKTCAQVGFVDRVAVTTAVPVKVTQVCLVKTCSPGPATEVGGGGAPVDLGVFGDAAGKLGKPVARIRIDYVDSTGETIHFDKDVKGLEINTNGKGCGHNFSFTVSL
jgi:hypothetical protein